MAFRTDRQIIEALLPIRFLSSVVFHGAAERADPDIVAVLAWLKAAEGEQLAGIGPQTRAKILRRSWKIYDAMIAPYIESETSCAKFGLVVFYLMAGLEQQGIYSFVAGSALDRAQAAIFSPDGTIVEVANVAGIDSSAQKQARRLLATLQLEGYFREAIPA